MCVCICARTYVLICSMHGAIMTENIIHIDMSTTTRCSIGLLADEHSEEGNLINDMLCDYTNFLN